MVLPCQKKAYSAYYARNRDEICARNRLVSATARQAERQRASENPEVQELVREKWRDKYRTGVAKKVKRLIGEWMLQNATSPAKPFFQELLHSEKYKDLTVKRVADLIASHSPTNNPS